ncbi:hypothetical protein BAUCODRAFT_238697 [Baudoinia panamericana UAMH 10762]|uniref:Uncharacterized protein n=1 Tax=Baudoinia panamericana (strain UAMH 10762) TaxID=717646 RepID=M2N318_BAUPA|nr:uncharacterized protein BAUCODRAFT_238697 [Baudoinia panamericana UAMH 10762]EMC93374.1 hypothetical protein BAUCODRAFT_238697 [Baudoinia panamericana UAMH 10762]
MICQRCLRRLAHQSAQHDRSHASKRALSTTKIIRSTPVTAETTTTNVPRPDGRPAATSRPGVAQPISTPLTASPDRQELPISRKQTKAPAKLPASSMPAGTVMKGLNFMKNKPDPIAMEDGAKAGREGDLFAKSKKQRQKAAKALRKQALLHPEALAPKVPLTEQTVDLPTGDGTLEGARSAEEARGELTAALRGKRRSKIKEDNYLRSMR